MKKHLFSLVFVFAMVVFTTTSASAQKYFVYDGSDFSVMLTANSNNTQILKVQFSLNGQWVNFDIQDYESLEDEEDGGFVYYVVDTKGKEYSIDYYRSGDHIMVYGESHGGEWRLNRRKE